MEHYQTEEYRGYTIHIDYDTECESPREWDNIAHMIGFLPHYQIGDKHHYSSEREFLSHLARCYVSYDQIEKYLREHRGDCWLEETAGGFALHDGTSAYYDAEYEKDEPVEAIIDQCWDYMTDQDIFNLVSSSDELVIQPMAYYDHSGVTVWIGEGHGWDSGQAGWIYQTKRDTINEQCATEENWRELALKNMQAEMKTYDSYVRGDCYGYIVEDEDGNVIDSCWGYIDGEHLGDIMSEAKAVIDTRIQQAEEKRARLLDFLKANFERLPENQLFVSGGTAWRTDRNNLFRVLQLSSAPIKNNMVGVFDTADFNNVPTVMLECMRSTINKSKTMQTI